MASKIGEFVGRTGDLSREIASRSVAIDFFVLGYALPNPDLVLKKMGRDIRVYSEIRTDPHVGGAIRRRKAAVMAMESAWRGEDCRPEVIELVENAFKKLNLRQLIDDILEAPLYGYQPLEVMWNSDTWLPDSVIAKPQHWFIFDTDNKLKLRTRYDFMGEDLPDRKFLLPRQDATYANPYGFPDLSMCYWPVVFKKGGLKFWVTFAEKYGMPWVIGKHPRGTGESEISELLNKLESLVADAVGVIPDDSSIEIKEALGKAEASGVFEGLIEQCRSEINIALLGQNQTTESNANKASAQAGRMVTIDIRDGDAQIVSDTLGILARWIVDLHFGEDEPSPCFEMWEQKEVDDIKAKRDHLLAGSGARFTEQYYTREYSLQPGDLDVVAMRKVAIGMSDKSSLDFAENTNGDYADRVTSQLARAGQPVIQSWLERIGKVVADAKSWDSLTTDLVNEFAELDQSELVKVMELAFSAADLTGRTEVLDGH